MRKIREIRKQKGDTLKELADKVQYDFSNLSKIERGQVKPSIKLLSKIADIYGFQKIKWLTISHTELLTPDFSLACLSVSPSSARSIGTNQLGSLWLAAI